MAASRSASAKIIFGFFPPSSSEIFLNKGAPASATLRPVTVPPVNEMVPIFGLAVIDRLGASELLQITLDKIGNAQENARPVRTRGPRPFYERFLCRSHGEINIARIAVRYLRICLPGCGLDIV